MTANATISIALGLFGLLGTMAAHADATIPAKDIANARDNPLLKRYDGSFIVSYERLAFTDFKLPLSKLERVEGDARDRMNNSTSRRRSWRSRARAPALPICCRPPACRWRCCATIRTW